MINGISRILAKNVKETFMRNHVNNHFQILSGTWAELEIAAKLVREKVFIDEQNIAADDEWDELDAVSTHFVVRDDEQVIATARLLQNDSIGRVAVLKSHRGLGVGYELMAFIIDYAKQTQRQNLKLSAQVHAISFYQRLGFKQQGSEYLDCGIPHVDMHMSLA